jgi:hypothetical protein
MFIKTISILASIFIIFGLSVHAAFNSPPDTTDYYSDTRIRYDDHIYQQNIRSVLLYKLGFELSDPIIQMNTDDRLELEFDDLQGNIKEYYYSFSHCSATWVPTEIWPNEYLEGMLEDRIETYSFSFNTRQTYTHYKVSFPNMRLNFKLSGNYLLKVYTKDINGEEELALTRRFMVFEPKVALEAKVQRATTIEDYETNQEIDFAIHAMGYRIDAPFQDIMVILLQNFRWDNALTNLKPFMVKGEILDYAYDNGSNQFSGGNEFRHFDLKSVKYLSDMVREIGFENGMYYANLWESERRTFKVYVIDDDIDGKFLLKSEDQADVETMGEYVNVRFFLPYSAPIAHGSLYVAGGFNCWQYTPENRMVYNFKRHGYEADILFKQGYYNYQYILLPNNSGKGDESFIEGSHHETENNYTLLVYHHAKGTLYDQLIAVGSYNSKKTGVQK